MEKKECWRVAAGRGRPGLHVHVSARCTEITIIIIKDASHTLDFDKVRMPRLLSVNVGLPRDLTWNGKTVRTAVWKSPVAGRRMVRRLNVQGDARGAARRRWTAQIKVTNLPHLHDRSDLADRLLTTLNRWRGPLRGMCSYAVPSQKKRASRSIFKRPSFRRRSFKRRFRRE